MNRLRRSNSTVSTRSKSSLMSLEDIVNEEDEVLHSNANLQNWSISKIDKIEVYRTSWIQSTFQSENKVKTVERAYPLNKDKDECLLFNKKVIKELKKKGYKSFTLD